MYNTCGSCPHCGAPIYTYSGGWLSILPPPVNYTCDCRFYQYRCRRLPAYRPMVPAPEPVIIGPIIDWTPPPSRTVREGSW